MNRSALLVLLLLAIPYAAEARASGRAAAVVPICVHPKPSCYPLHCSAQLKPQNRSRYGRIRCDLFMPSEGATSALGTELFELTMSVLGAKPTTRLRRRTSENETQLGNEPDHAVRPQSWAHLKLTARARDRRNDRHADGAAGRLRDSRHGHHAAPLHVRSLDRARVSSGLEACSSRDSWC
jgi:hypothetical protein